jgi:hypothetical protein
MVEMFRESWPEEALSLEDFRQHAQLFKGFSVATVLEVISDRIEAELGMPDLVELSRVLRVYAPMTAKSDPQPTPPPKPWKQAPGPFLDSTVKHEPERVGEMREALAVGVALGEQRPKDPPQPPADKELFLVPPAIREALEAGVAARSKARIDRLSNRAAS